jgi:uncharacterized protein
MEKMYKFLIVPVLLGLSSFAQAKDIPKSPDNYVMDEPHVLSEATVNQLHATLAKLDKDTGKQVVVAIFTSLDGEDLEDYSHRVFHEWKIGQSGKNNGVLLTLYWKEHKGRIDVGYGLEPVLTDAKSKDILHNAVMANLKQHKTDEAITAGVSQIVGLITDPVKSVDPLPVAPTVVTAESDNKAARNLLLLIGFLVVVCVGGSYLYAQAEKKRKKRQREENDERNRKYRVAQEAQRKAAEERRQKDLAADKLRLQGLYPTMSYAEAQMAEERKLELEQQKARRAAEEKQRKQTEQYVTNKWGVGVVVGMTLALAIQKEAEEVKEYELKRRAAEKASRLKREKEEEEEEERSRRRTSSSSSYSSSDSSSSSSSSDSDSGSFSGGGGDSGGGGSSDSW